MRIYHTAIVGNTSLVHFSGQKQWPTASPRAKTVTETTDTSRAETIDLIDNQGRIKRGERLPDGTCFLVYIKQKPAFFDSARATRAIRNAFRDTNTEISAVDMDHRLSHRQRRGASPILVYLGPTNIDGLIFGDALSADSIHSPAAGYPGVFNELPGLIARTTKTYGIYSLEAEITPDLEVKFTPAQRPLKSAHTIPDETWAEASIATFKKL